MEGKKKILLTGGGGFIGRNILEQLGGKYDFLAPSSAELNLLDTETVSNYLRQYKPQIILHSANIGGNRKQTAMTRVCADNIRMFFNLTRNDKYFDRMIVFGSGAEYDKSRDIHLINEGGFGQRIPVDEYGLAKFTMSKLAESINCITHLRFFGVFGKYEDCETRFISNAICKKVFDLPITIKKNVIFDYIYVKDLVNILDFFIQNKPPEKFYNIGRGEPIDLLTLAKIVNSAEGEEGEIKIMADGLNNEYSCDTTRLKKLIGDYRFYSFESAIKELFNYYRGVKNKMDINKFLSDI